MSHIMSRAALFLAAFACVLSSATTADAYRPLPLYTDVDDKDNSDGNDIEGNGDDSSYQDNRGGVNVAVMVVVLIVMLLFSVALTIFVIRARRAARLTSDGWKDLESQCEKFENVDLSEPEHVDVSEPEHVDVSEPEHVDVSEPGHVDVSEPEPVHQPNKKNRTTDTWDKYLSMIQSPTRLNSTVGKMKTQNRS